MAWPRGGRELYGAAVARLRSSLKIIVARDGSEIERGTAAPVVSP
jgi:hypothetical protein